MFAEDLDAAFLLIEDFPHAGQAVPHRAIRGLRRIELSRVRYHLYYVVDVEMRLVKVLAVWHMSRGTRPRF